MADEHDQMPPHPPYSPPENLVPGTHDLAVDQVPSAVRTMLDEEHPWLNSWLFCTVYEDPWADRVRFRITDDGSVTSPVYYRFRRWLGAIRIAELVGYPDIKEEELQGFAAHHAHVVVLQRLVHPREGTPVKPVAYDVIVDLPPATDQYLHALGRQKRQQLPRYWRRLQREYGQELTIDVKAGRDIAIDDILTLARFNQTRMARKGKGNEMASESRRQQRRWPVTQEQGLMLTFRAAGRILGGTFNYLHRDEAFLIVIAHDPALERLNIGNLAVWKTIEHMIDRGVRRYHLWWGRSAYKTQFLGVDHAVYEHIWARYPLLDRAWRARLSTVRLGQRARQFLARKLHPPPRPSRPHSQPEIPSPQEGSDDDVEGDGNNASAR